MLYMVLPVKLFVTAICRQMKVRRAHTMSHYGMDRLTHSLADMHTHTHTHTPTLAVISHHHHVLFTDNSIKR